MQFTTRVCICNANEAGMAFMALVYYWADAFGQTQGLPLRYFKLLNRRLTARLWAWSDSASAMASTVGPRALRPSGVIC